jgi:hypothetical protein
MPSLPSRIACHCPADDAPNQGPQHRRSRLRTGDPRPMRGLQNLKSRAAEWRSDPDVDVTWEQFAVGGDPHDLIVASADRHLGAANDHVHARAILLRYLARLAIRRDVEAESARAFAAADVLLPADPDVSRPVGPARAMNLTSHSQAFARNLFFANPVGAALRK